jgi:hypothetical protein
MTITLGSLSGHPSVAAYPRRLFSLSSSEVSQQPYISQDALPDEARMAFAEFSVFIYLPVENGHHHYNF